jgi:hypothetical protein
MRQAALAILVAAALAPVASSLAQDENQPIRKPGWWEMQLVIVGASAYGAGTTREPVHATFHICADPEVDKAHSPFGVNMSGRACQSKTVRTATGWTVSGSCLGGKITGTSVVTGDLNDRYHVDVVFHMDPSVGPETTETTIGADARWVGQCPADMKPGEGDGAVPGAGF